MAKFDRVQTSFRKGELSPRVFGHYDLVSLQEGAKTLLNMVVLPQGGAWRLPGTRFVAETKDSSKESRIIPFEYSEEQSYVIGAEAGTFRFYTQESRLENPPGTPVELTVPYTESQIQKLLYAQSADVMFLGNPEVKPKELRRTSATAFSLVDYDFADGPYLDINTTTTTLILNPGSGAGTIASGTTGVTVQASTAIFVSAAVEVDRVIRIKKRNGGGWTWLKITGFTSTTTVTATLRGDTADKDSSTVDWALGAWYGPDNWPRAVQFHEERLWWGGTKAQPMSIWGSVSSDFDNHRPNNPADSVVSDSDAMNVLFASNKVNAVRWLNSASAGLLVGTSGAEVLLQSSSTTKGLTPTSISRKFQSYHGSKEYIIPVDTEESIVFVSKGGRDIKGSVYSGVAEKFITESIANLSEHLIRSGVKRLAWAGDPIPILWGISNNKLLGATIKDFEDVHPEFKKTLAWHSHEYMGTNVAVEDICVIPYNNEAQLWLVIRRTINGTTKRYVEFLENWFEGTDTLEAFFLDSGVSGTITGTTVSGLSHLNGETVGVLVAGATHPDRVVSGGSITLQESVTNARVHVGLKKTAKIAQIPIDVGLLGGSTSGKTKGLFRAQVHFESTVGAKIGPSESMLEELTFRAPDDPMDQAVPLFSGKMDLPIDAPHAKDVALTIVNDQPLPMHVIGITIRASVGGD